MSKTAIKNVTPATANTNATDVDTMCNDVQSASIKLSKAVAAKFIAAAANDGKIASGQAKAGKRSEVDLFVDEGEALCKKYEKYYTDYIVRGNKALYELLSSIYAYALRIETSASKSKILKRMRDELEKLGVKTTSATHWLTTIVRFIIRNVDRQTAFNYKRVLAVAMEDNIPANDLAGYIEQHGGVMKFKDIVGAAAQGSSKAGEAKERAQLMRDFLLAWSQWSKERLNYSEFMGYRQRQLDGKKVKDEAKHEPSTFRHFFGLQQPDGQFLIVGAAEFSKEFEDVIFKHMTYDFSKDMEAARSTVKELQAEQQKAKEQLAAKK